MPEHWFLLTVSLIITYLYGSVFTLLFLDIDLQDGKNSLPFGLFSFCSIAVQLTIGYFASSKLVELVYPLVVHVPLLLLCMLCYKKNFLTALSAIMMCYFLTAPRYILGELIILVVPFLPCPEHFGKIIASLLLAFPIYKWVRPILAKGFRRPANDILHFFVPLTLVYFLSYLLYVYTDLLVTNGILMMEIVFTLFLIVILYYVKKYFISIDDIVEKENRNHILELSYGAVKKQLNILTESNEQTRILRHDIRHYATMIEQYAAIGNFEKITEISRELNEQNQTAVVQNFCSNQSVNLLLSNYLLPLTENSTEMHFQITVPKDIFVNDMDLCTLIGNVLDNAVKSVTGCRHKKFLSLILQCDENKFFMELKNSCETAVSFREGLPLTTKQGHGYGCKSIQYIAEKYHGISAFELSENIFITRVILHR